MIPVFDIETFQWSEPIAVGFYANEEYYEFFKQDKEDDVIWKFLVFLGKNFPGYRLFAHNAAGFDNRFILKALWEHHQKVLPEAGLGRLIWIDKDIKFEDSYVLIPKSLHNICEAFDVERKLDWDHDSTDYPWKMEQLGKFRAYLRRDCVALSKALDTYCQQVIALFGVPIAFTLSLTSAKAFSHKFCPLEKIESNEEFEPYIRFATYGGRNEVYRRYGEGVNLYDVRSMFVSCYDTPVPVGKMFWTSKDLSRGTITEAVVEIPIDLYIGPLPHRNRSKLEFPVGKLKGWWDTKELRFAEEVGCKVKVIRQLECEEAPILKEFGDYMSNLRYTASNPQLGSLWKLFGLRLSGKLGQSRWSSRVVPTSEIEDFTGMVPLDYEERFHEEMRYNRHNPYVKPAISMRIRAESRIRHARMMLDILKSGKSLYYCDTDSICTDAELPLGPYSGDLQLVGQAQRAYFVGCKVYGYKAKSGVFVQRTAGFSDDKLTEGDFQKLLKGEEITVLDRRANNWKEILAGLGIRFELRETGIKPYLPNRIIVGLDTQPIQVWD